MSEKIDARMRFYVLRRYRINRAIEQSELMQDGISENALFPVYVARFAIVCAYYPVFSLLIALHRLMRRLD